MRNKRYHVEADGSIRTQTVHITFDRSPIEIDVEQVKDGKYRVWVRPSGEDVFLDEGAGTQDQVISWIDGFRKGAEYYAMTQESTEAEA